MKNVLELIKFILVFILMVFSVYIVKNFLEIFGIMYTPGNYFLYTIYDSFGSLLVMVVLIILMRKELKNNLLDLFKNPKKLITLVAIMTFGYIMIVNIEVVCSLIEKLLFYVFQIETAKSDNQQQIETIIHAAPYLMVISTNLFAPIEEELLFRGLIRKTIKNKGVFIAVSGLFFGILHITDNYIFLILFIILAFALSTIIDSKNKASKKLLLSVISVAVFIAVFAISMTIVHGNLLNYFYSIDPKELITGIRYVVLGCYLACIYALTDNIYYTIGLHMVTNTIATIVLLTS